MRLRPLILAGILATFAAPALALSCQIRFLTEGEYVTLEAIVSSDSPAEGSYVMGVTTVTGSNSSTSMQGGPVVISHSEGPILLAKSVHRITEQTRLTAQLTIEADDMRTSCKANTDSVEDI